ncbi:MAG: DeoR/GlpR transcriptional regulator [Clostridia bacterium]|nr:DeoR/GlpR transcriptional regulator [Clostridia bacterium]
MLINERQNKILEFLKKNKTAYVKALARALYVSEATVRRDLNEMQKSGLIERSHGGAILPDNADEISMFVRMNKNAKEKELAATNALKHLPDFKTVFVDSSSTALALAERMDLNFKTVVTNSLLSAMQLSKKQNVNLILLGGNVQYNTNSATGSWTARLVREFSFDLMLSSCAAVNENGVFERSLEQKEIKLAAFERSKTRILIVDSSKFSDVASYRMTGVDSYAFIATDKKPPEALLTAGVKILF